jgi:hypothetical protein
MTDQQHPITPPPELFAEWLAKAKRLHPGESTGFIAGEVARLAYQTGADQELEACLEWVKSKHWIEPEFADELRAARRPKPPSLKEQALDELKTSFDMGYLKKEATNIIRRALEQIDD